MFYLTLPSNSSLQFYPENTLTHFTTHLPHTINLQGQWEVGLAEIQYPHTWHNLSDGEGWITMKKYGKENRLTLPLGQYDTPEQLIASLNELFEEPHTSYSTKRPEIDILPASPSVRNIVDVHFSYHNVTQKTTISVQPGIQVELSNTLRVMLGMKEMQLSEGTHEGVHVVDVNQGFYSLYVYCSIVEPRPEGDCKVPLLRIVPVEGKSGQMVMKTYENIQYIPLIQKNFRTIEIDIKKDTGEIVPFELGKLVVTLHFRKQRPYL